MYKVQPSRTVFEETRSGDIKFKQTSESKRYEVQSNSMYLLINTASAVLGIESVKINLIIKKFITL